MESASAPRGSKPLYSKSAVDRAGRIYVELFSQPSRNAATGWIVEHWQELDEADRVIDWWRRQHAYPLTMVNAGLRHYLKRHPDIRPTQRLKKRSTIASKLARFPKMNLSRMQDVGGVRVVLPNQSACDELSKRLRANWRAAIVGYDDYVRGPKPSGYRALHLIVMRNGFRIEIQLRTSWQDMWAQSAEEDTARLGIGLKFDLGPDDLREYYWLAGEMLAAQAEDRTPDAGVVQRLAELHPLMRRYFLRHRQ
jgi:putative GTP pyrophosphokinase